MNNHRLKNELTIHVHDDTDIRLDVFLTGKLKNLSRSRVHDLILSGDIQVNNAQSKPSHRLKDHDTVSVNIPPPQALEVVPEEMSLSIVYEDDFYLALNKPRGLVVHPGAGNFQGTLVSGLLNYTENLSSVGGKMRPGLVHRLDKDTSGVLIVAKTDEAHWKLGKLFFERQIYKEYRALVCVKYGKALGEIRSAIARLSAVEMAQKIEKGGTVEIQINETKVFLTAEDLLIERQDADGISVVFEGEYTVAVDTVLTEDLINEGYVRDLIRQVQTMRKDADFKVEERISVSCEPTEKINNAMNQFNEYLKRETLATDLKFQFSSGEIDREFMIDGNKVRVSITRIQ